MKVMNILFGLLLLILITCAVAQARRIEMVKAYSVRTSAIANGNTVLFERQLDVDQGINLTIKYLATGAATGTVQFFLQDSNDGGLTWDDVVASKTFAFGTAIVTATNETERYLVALSIDTGITQGSVVSSLALSAGTVRKGPLGGRIRLVERITGVSGTPTGCQYSYAMTAR